MRYLVLNNHLNNILMSKRSLQHHLILPKLHKIKQDQTGNMIEMIIQLLHWEIGAQADLAIWFLQLYPLDVLLFSDVCASLAEVFVLRGD